MLIAMLSKNISMNSRISDKYQPRIVDVSNGKTTFIEKKNNYKIVSYFDRIKTTFMEKNQVDVSKFPLHMQMSEWNSDGGIEIAKSTTHSKITTHLVHKRHFLSTFW